VLDLAKAQEVTRAQELRTKEAEYNAAAARGAAERERVHFEELRRTQAAQNQSKAELARYEDQLARARAAAEHESARERNAETVRLQEVVAERQEAVRRASEEKIQVSRRQTEVMKAELERETLRAKALAEAEGRAAEGRANKDVTSLLQRERIEAETVKAVAVVRATAEAVGGGLSSLLEQPRAAAAAVLGLTALALGVYGAREGARVAGAQAAALLGTPSLVRETTRGGALARARGVHVRAAPPATPDALLSGVVLSEPLRARVAALAASTANARLHGAPLRHMLFHGPPGTGKTLVARQMALRCGLDYAVMSGGDVAPLGAKAVTQLHELFDWAASSRKGVLLFIDEADAFLARRGGPVGGAEEVRAALNALLYRTGSPSSRLALVLATNRPADLDAAVLDRVDEALEFPLPAEGERLALIQLYLGQYLGAGAGGAPAIQLERDLDAEALKEAARATVGFSGRELAKLMLSVQAAVYGAPGGGAGATLRLGRAAFERVLHDKVNEHAEKRKWTATA